MTVDPSLLGLAPVDAELVVVGAGPAGLAAAATAAAGGLTVVLIDAGTALGGQFWRHPAEGARLPDPAASAHGVGTYRQLVTALGEHQRAGRVRRLLGCQVWTVEAVGGGLRLHCLDRSGGVGADRAVTVTGRQVVLATGAYDRQLPFPGWDLPGVFAAGGLQALVKGHAVQPGSRVVLGGTGPFLLPVAVGLQRAGATVVGICEANDPRRWGPQLRAVAGVPEKAREGLGYAAALARARVPVWLRTAIVAAHGTDRVDAVTIARLGPAGQVLPGLRRRVEVDTVGVGWGFEPHTDLAVTLGAATRADVDGTQVVIVDQWQRTSVPGLLAAGEICGVGGAELALREGQLAAEAALQTAGRPPVTTSRDLGRVRGIVRRHRVFAAALQRAHPIPARWPGWLTDDTVVCRCEEVGYAAVRAAIEEGAHEHRQVKQLTRAGMGWCQGRMCQPAISRLDGITHGTGRPAERLVAMPVPLGALAGQPGIPNRPSPTEPSASPQSTEEQS